MPLGSSNNSILFANCESLKNPIVTFHVSLDMITEGNNGFSLQMNCYPQTKPQATYNGKPLNWFQYVIAVENNEVQWGIQYWSEVKGDGFGPPGSYSSFASVSSNQVPAGSVMRISLQTDSSNNVTSATFDITDPSGNLSDYTYTFPSNCQCQIYGFQVDIVGPPSGTHTCKFTSGLGVLTYWLGGGTLAVQSTNTCGGTQPGTAETSNTMYGNIVPASGQQVYQLVVGA